MDTVSKGKDFEDKVIQKLKEMFNCDFNDSNSRPDLITFKIGDPAKPHKFDGVSCDRNIVVECKDNDWSITGKVPSGKLRTILSEVLYLSKLPKDIKKIIVLRKYFNEKYNTTLGKYFVNKYGHLMSGITVMELDTDNMELEQIFM